MTSSKWIWCAGALAALAAGPAAQAAIVTLTFTGTTITTQAEIDFPGVWGVDAYGQDIIGDTFTSTTVYNTSRPTTTVYPDENNNDQTPGEAVGAFTIAGLTYDVRSSAGFANYYRTPGFLDLELSLDPQANAGDIFQVFSPQLADDGLNSPATVTAGDITSSDGNAVLLGANGGVLRANFVIDAVTVTSNVPEPAAWASMLLGFAVVGGIMRRRVGGANPATTA